MGQQPVQQPDIRAVIFDLGGVILRTDDPLPRMELAKRLGKTRLELETIVFACPASALAEEGQGTMEAVWESVQQALNLRTEEVPAFIEAFFGGDRVDFDLIHLIRALRPAYRTAILSNGWRTNLETYLVEGLQIPADTFDLVISSAACKLVKPNPEIFHLALERLGVEAQQAVFVDDNRANIEAAQKIGLHTVHFLNAQQAQQEIRQYVHLP